jgi:hypothetical protein
MVIEYIYLLLILVLIGSILFLIYLSYEYRTIEPFIVTQLDTYNGITPNIRTAAINHLSNYQDLINNAYTQQINKQNIINLDLLDKTQLNISNSAKLEKMNKNLNVITDEFPNDKMIKTIKNNYNSQYLSTNANDKDKYGILMNDKCLTVGGLCKDDYCLLNCQNNLYTSNSQKFYPNRIYNDTDAAAVMNVDISKINNKNVYPFNIFRSAVNNKCLSVTNDGVTIEKCNLNDLRHQWKISPNENICVLN